METAYHDEGMNWDGEGICWLRKGLVLGGRNDVWSWAQELKPALKKASTAQQSTAKHSSTPRFGWWGKLALTG